MGNTGSSEAGAALTKKEVERMQRRFQKLANKSGRVALTEFQRIPELSVNPFVPRIFQLSDTDEDGYITFEDFTRAVETLGKLYSDQEKQRFAFGLYDLDGDGLVSQRDLLGVLQNTSSKQAVGGQQLERVVTTLLQEYDSDRDGHLSFPEFQNMLTAGGPQARPFLG